MIIEEWIQEKKALQLPEPALAKSTRIMLAWWNLSESQPDLRTAMKTEADKILREKPG